MRRDPGVWVYCVKCWRHSRMLGAADLPTEQWFKKSYRNPRAVYLALASPVPYAECPEHGELGPSSKLSTAIFLAKRYPSIPRKVYLAPVPPTRPSFFDARRRNIEFLNGELSITPAARRGRGRWDGANYPP